MAARIDTIVISKLAATAPPNEVLPPQTTGRRNLLRKNGTFDSTTLIGPFTSLDSDRTVITISGALVIIVLSSSPSFSMYNAKLLL